MTSTLLDPTPTAPEPVQTSLGFRGRSLPTDDPAILIGETWAAPGGTAGRLHRHLHQSETFEVIDGAITVRIGRSAHVVRAGETFHVPAGVAHTFVNHSDEEAHFRATFTPPMRLQELFTELAGIDGPPTLTQAAWLMRDYREEFFYDARLPVTAQRALGVVVRALTRRSHVDAHKLQQ
jgi:quercetin dioxygenase-like cupin family protein